MNTKRRRKKIDLFLKIVKFINLDYFKSRDINEDVEIRLEDLDKPNKKKEIKNIKNDTSIINNETSFVKNKMTLDSNESYIRNTFNRTIEKDKTDDSDSFENKVITAQRNANRSIHKKNDSGYKERERIKQTPVKRAIPTTPHDKRTITKSTDKPSKGNDKAILNELNVLKKQVAKLTKENTKLKQDLQKEKAQNIKFKELTEELIKFYEYIQYNIELLQKEKNEYIFFINI
jgi:hypothetical protein